MNGDRTYGEGSRWRVFRNDAAETAPAFGVLKITGAEAREFGAAATATKPDSQFCRVYAVNGPVKTAPGGYGLYTFEPAFALCDGTPEPGEGWGPTPGSWRLAQGGPAAFTVLGAAEGGTAWVQPERPVRLIGKLDGGLSAGGAATASIWSGEAGSETDSGMDVEARDWLMKAGAAAIAAGKKVKVEWINGQWYVTQAECS